MADVATNKQASHRYHLLERWEAGLVLTGAQSGRAIRLGDSVVVRVERVDAPRGRTDLAPVEL